jgi:pimeloyl-ACP methyl ester carboxylesterase
MQTVRSADGTSIAYDRHGERPPLVCLHGGSADRHSWQPLVDHLADDFSLVVPDRRGRGDSGDADGYGLGREVADLEALLDAVEDDATVFGHSFGGLVALAAAETRDCARLVLYEPAVLVGDHQDDLTARMQTRLDAGRTAEAMALFYREGAGIPDPEQLPVTPDEIGPGLAETVVRENAAVEGYDLAPAPDVDCPTLLLTGEHGPEHLRTAVRALDDRLPDVRCRELDEAGHLGPQSAPGRVAAAVRAFHPATAGVDAGDPIAGRR